MPSSIKKPLKSIIRESKSALNHVHHIFRRPLETFRIDWYSQHGEDGILAELLRRLSIRQGWVVEFGAWDGIWCSNTYHLIETNPRFNAVYIEGDAARFKDLLATTAKHPTQIVPIQAFITPSGEDSLDSLLSKTDLPRDFDILSVDVDSIDYQIWESFSEYQPKIVIIEVNSSIPLGVEQIHGEGKQGSSFTSMRALGERKGYTCIWHRGNCIFVRNDLVQTVLGTIPTVAEQDSFFVFKK